MCTTLNVCSIKYFPLSIENNLYAILLYENHTKIFGIIMFKVKLKHWQLNVTVYKDGCCKNKNSAKYYGKLTSIRNLKIQ